MATCGYNIGTEEERVRCGKIIKRGRSRQSYCPYHKRLHDKGRERRLGAHITFGPHDTWIIDIVRYIRTLEIRANKDIWDVLPDFNQDTLEVMK